jgi:hypothetical protein
MKMTPLNEDKPRLTAKVGGKTFSGYLIGVHQLPV